MSGDHLERLRAWRAFAGQNRPGYDHMRDVSYDKAPVCDADLDAALDELERLRAEVAMLHEAQIDMQTSAFRIGWQTCRDKVSRATEVLRGELAALDYALDLRQMQAEAAPQQPERDGEAGGA